MEPLVHFLLSVIAGLGIGLHMENKNKKYLMIILMAILATALDLDHLFPAYTESGIKIFHNIFIFINIPVVLLLSMIFWERGKSITQKQRYALLLCVMFPGHMFTDIISGAGVSLFYPFNTNTVTVGNIGLSVNTPLLSLQAYQVLLIFWGAVIVCANLTETFTYLDVEGRKQHQSKALSKKTNLTRPRTWLPMTKGQGSFSQKMIFPSGVAKGKIPQGMLSKIEIPSISMPINEIQPDTFQTHDIPWRMNTFKEIPNPMIPLRVISHTMIPEKEISRTMIHIDDDPQYRSPMIKNPLGLNSKMEDSTKYIFSFVDRLSEKR